MMFALAKLVATDTVAKVALLFLLFYVSSYADFYALIILIVFPFITLLVLVPDTLVNC